MPALSKNSPSLIEHISIKAACLAFILLDDEQQGRALSVSFDKILQSEIWKENNSVEELSKRSKQNMKKDLETAFGSLWR